MKAKLECPKCGHKWERNYFYWVWQAPFHMFSIKTMRDRRKTKCPNCGEKSWIARNK